MPMIWDSTNEAKLFANVIQVANVKLSSAQFDELARLMGPDCTAKAIKHRMAAIRKRAEQGNGDGEGEEEVPKTKKAKTTKTTGGRKKKKTAAAEEASEEGTPDAAPPSPPSSGGKKRKRGGAAIKQEDGIEVGEDVGQGLRARVGGDEDGEDDDGEEWV